MQFYNVTKLAAIMTICFVSHAAANEKDCDNFLTEDFFRSATVMTVSSCLGDGSAIDARNADGDTALHLAAAYAPDAAVTRVLLRAGADVELKNALGWTPMHMSAAFSTDPAQIATLVVWGSEVNGGTVKDECPFFGQCTTMPLHLAALRPDAVNLAATLLAAGAETDIYSAAALKERIGNLERDRHLLPLHLAARLGGVETVGLLLRAGADPSAADKGSRQRTALHHAASREDGAIKIVQTLLDAGAPADAQDFEDNTPLMLAVSKSNDPAVFALLLERSENPCSKNTRGSDALDMHDAINSGGNRDETYWSLHETCR